MVRPSHFAPSIRTVLESRSEPCAHMEPNFDPCVGLSEPAVLQELATGGPGNLQGNCGTPHMLARALQTCTVTLCGATSACQCLSHAWHHMHTWNQTSNLRKTVRTCMAAGTDNWWTMTSHAIVIVATCAHRCKCSHGHATALHCCTRVFNDALSCTFIRTISMHGCVMTQPFVTAAARPARLLGLRATRQ